MDPRLAAERFWPRLAEALAQVDPERTRPPEDARAGAVLVLLEQTEAGPEVVLTRRRRDLRSHPGQISFAGGRLDEGETVEDAALREAQEEIGLDRSTVELLGAGPTFYIPPSRFWVVPVVARWVAPHPTDPNPWEVDDVIRVPISHLLEEARWRKVPLSLRGASWAWQLDSGDLLWGATAIVMALLLDVAVEGWSGGRRPEDLPDDRAVRPWEDAPSWQRPARLDGELPGRPQAEVPHVTADQMRAARRLLGDHGVTRGLLAEQAGRAVAHAVRRLVGGSLRGVTVRVLAGPGGNGAGGLAAARLFASAGAEVAVLLTGPPALPRQLSVLEAAGVQTSQLDDSVPHDTLPGDVVVDAMLGIGADPPLHGVPDRVNAWLQRFAVPVVALDLPSGLGADEGLRGACVNADVTVTLGAPKVGLRPRIVHPYMGDLYLADIGIPPSVWQAVGVEPIVFPDGPLVRLTMGDRAPDAGTPDQGELSASEPPEG